MCTGHSTTLRGIRLAPMPMHSCTLRIYSGPINVNITLISLSLIFVFCGRSRQSFIHISIRSNTVSICVFCDLRFVSCRCDCRFVNFSSCRSLSAWPLVNGYAMCMDHRHHCVATIRSVCMPWPRQPSRARFTYKFQFVQSKRSNRFSQQHHFLIARMYRNNVTLHNAQREICKCRRTA